MAKRLRPDDIMKKEPVVIVIEDSEDSVEEGEACSICLDTYKVKATLACAHSTCFSCFHKNYYLYKRKCCPLCKSAIDTVPRIQSDTRVMVRSLSGKTDFFPMDVGMSVDDFSAVYYYRTGAFMDIDLVRFIFHGRSLVKGKLLSDYGIVNDSLLHSISRLRGD